MNEYLIDYKEEDIKGKKYYKLPKVPNRKLRNFLISGLDTSDREVGVFHKFGFYVIQPYNALVYQYLAIHPDYLSQKNFKLKFNGDMIPSTLFKLIPKKKNRAQTANDNLGILDLFIDKNITQNDLMKKFNKIYCSKSANEIIDIGRYRN